MEEASRMTAEEEAWKFFNPMVNDHNSQLFNCYNRNTYSNIDETVAMSMQVECGSNRRLPLEAAAILHVSYIPITVSELCIRNLFSKFGKVLRVKMLQPRAVIGCEMLRSAKVTYATLEEAEKAIYNAHKAEPFNLRVAMDRSVQEQYDGRTQRIYASYNGGNNVGTGPPALRNCSDGYNYGYRPPQSRGRNYNSVNCDQVCEIGGGDRRDLYPGGRSGQGSGNCDNYTQSAEDMATINRREPDPSAVLMNIVKTLKAPEPKKDLSVTLATSDDQRIVRMTPELPELVSRSHDGHRPPPPSHSSTLPPVVRETQHSAPQSVVFETTTTSHSYQEMPPPELIVELCCLCKTDKGTMRCSGCKNASYCSAICQKRDWREHQRVCVVPPAPRRRFGSEYSEEVLNTLSPDSEKENSVSAVLDSATCAVFRNSDLSLATLVPVSKTSSLPFRDDRLVGRAPIENETSVPQFHSPNRESQPHETTCGAVREIAKAPSIPIDHTVKVNVSYVKGVSHFYAQVEESFLKFKSVEHLLNTPENASVAPLQTAKVGDVVSCRYGSDNLLYRASVVKVHTNSTTVLVKFIDYGNTETAAIKDLLPLDNYCRCYPVQALLCGLHSITPVKWSDADNENFRMLSASPKVHARMVCVDPDGKMLLELTNAITNGKSISERLETLRNPPPIYTQNTVSRITVSTATSLAPLPALIRTSFVDTWLAEQVYGLTVSVQEEETTDHFWAIGDGNVSSESMTELFKQLDACSEALPLVERGRIAPNALVTAKNIEGGPWMRAVVLSVNESSEPDTRPTTYQIIYLDFGLSEEVRDVRLLPERFCRLPSLAVLVDTEPGGPKVSGNLQVRVERPERDGIHVRLRQDNNPSATVPVGRARVISVWKYVDRMWPSVAAATPEAGQSPTVEDHCGAPTLISPTAEEHVPKSKQNSDQVSPIKAECQSPTAEDHCGTPTLISPTAEEHVPKSKENSDQVSPIKAECPIENNQPKSKQNSVQVSPIKVESEMMVHAEIESLPLTRDPIKFVVRSKNRIEPQFVSPKRIESTNMLPSVKSPSSSTLSLASTLSSPASSVSSDRFTIPPSHASLEPRTAVVAVALESRTSLQVQVFTESGKCALKALGDLSAVCQEDPGLDYFRTLPVCGQLVCAQYSEDGEWYRAVVLRVMPPDDVWVRFADYGNLEKTSLSRLKRLPDYFRAIPMVWREVALLIADPLIDLPLLSEVVAPNSRWTAVPVDYPCVEGEPPLVTLVDKQGCSLDELLAAAVSRSIPSYSAPSTSAIDAQGVDIDGADTDSFCAKLQVASRVDVVFTYVKSPSDVNVCRYADLNKMTRLSKQINTHCTEVAIDGYQPKRGEICLAQSNSVDDCTWYRAKVFHVADGKVHVIFIDFGNVEVINSGCVRLMPPLLAKMAPLAIKCSLEGYSEFPEWPEDILSFLKKSLPEFEQMSIDVVKETSNGCFQIRIPHLEKDFKTNGILKS